LPSATIERIEKIAEKLGYHPNMLARRLASNKSFQIGYAVPLTFPGRGAFQIPYFSMILDAAVIESFARSYNIAIYPLGDDSSSCADKLTDLVKTKQVDGLIVSGLKRGSPVPGFLKKEGIPFVIVGSLPEISGIPCVNYSPGKAIKRLLAELSRKSYRKIHFVTGDMNYYDAVNQKEIFTECLVPYNFNVREHVGDYSRACGYRLAPEIVENIGKEKECVFFANDRMASGFFRYCAENRINIPGTLGVCGCDDEDYTKALYPSLTTIRQPRARMGHAAVDVLMKSIEKPSSEINPVEIEAQFILNSSI
jgi:LacI family transcriptional regulator